MAVRTKIGIGCLILLLVGGLWLVAAPFVVGYQPLDKPWSAAVGNDVVVGGLLAGISFLGLAVYVADLLRDVARRGRDTR